MVLFSHPCSLVFLLRVPLASLLSSSFLPIDSVRGICLIFLLSLAVACLFLPSNSFPFVSSRAACWIGFVVFPSLSLFLIFASTVAVEFHSHLFVRLLVTTDMINSPIQRSYVDSDSWGFEGAGPAFGSFDSISQPFTTSCILSVLLTTTLLFVFFAWLELVFFFSSIKLLNSHLVNLS